MYHLKCKTLRLGAIFVILLSSIIFAACSNKENTSTTPHIKEDIVNSSKSADEAYDMLHVVFAGEPEKESIQKLMSPVMKSYGLEENYENLNRCGSALLSMRKSSAIGITEMEILKHMYQHGSTSNPFPTQAAISALYLEENN
jgi:hypothetical protein